MDPQRVYVRGSKFSHIAATAEGVTLCGNIYLHIVSPLTPSRVKELCRRCKSVRDRG